MDTLHRHTPYKIVLERCSAFQHYDFMAVGFVYFESGRMGKPASEWITASQQQKETA